MILLDDSNGSEQLVIKPLRGSVPRYNMLLDVTSEVLKRSQQVNKLIQMRKGKRMKTQLAGSVSCQLYRLVGSWA